MRTVNGTIKHILRAAMLLLTVMTTMTAGATTEAVSYIDADGNTLTHEATVLTGSESSLAAGWYVAKGTLEMPPSAT